MKNEVQKFQFNQQEVDFELTNENVMVNATQMAKLFNRLPKDFLILESTKDFISECLKKENSPFISIEVEEDLVISRQKSGTWMHRILALKFAAWLNPQFELWIYHTIEQMLFGRLKELEASLKVSAVRKNKMDELKNKLRASDEYAELERLELEERQAAYRRGKENRNQLDLFRVID